MEEPGSSYDGSSSTTMSTNQPRGFNAATDVLAFMQAFTTESVRHPEALQPRRSGSGRLKLRIPGHRATRSRSA